MAIKVSPLTLRNFLKDGPLSVDVLAVKTGRSNAHDFLDDLEELDVTLRNMAELGVGNEGLITLFPARSAERYGFANLVPVVKGENPDAKKRKRKNPPAPKKPRKDGSMPVTYWPFVALGNIVPAPAAEGVKYDGRWDDEEIPEIEAMLGDALTADGSLFKDWTIRATNGAIKLVPPGE
jgi:hypothetical protein